MHSFLKIVLQLQTIYLHKGKTFKAENYLII